MEQGLMFHFREHIFHNMKVPSQLRLQQRGGEEDMWPRRCLGVFIFQRQKPAPAREVANAAKSAHALALWSILCIKGVSLQEPKGCTLPKDWNLWEFGTTNTREILNPPARELVFCRLSSFKLLPTSWPKRPFGWEIVIQVFSKVFHPC